MQFSGLSSEASAGYAVEHSDHNQEIPGSILHQGPMTLGSYYLFLHFFHNITLFQIKFSTLELNPFQVSKTQNTV